jgi:hypothetical protein
MKTKLVLTLFVLFTLLLPGSSSGAAQTNALATALGTAITYQGRLTDGGVSANEIYDFQFKLYNAEAGGAQVGSLVTRGDVPVSDGYFTVQLDFGAGAFGNEARWLEVAVRPGTSTGAYTVLSPRQALTPAPSALYASAAGSLPWSGLTGVPAGFADGVDNDTTYAAGAGLSLSGGQFSLLAAYRLPQGCSNGQIPKWNGSAWACGDDNGGGAAWSLAGNAGTNPASNYLGTSDNQAFELRVNGQRALRLEPAPYSTITLIGGYSGNMVSAGVFSATISGGGASGIVNRVTDGNGTIGGGVFNTAGNNNADVNDSSNATVSGGSGNIAGGYAASVGGGATNSASGYGSNVAGGINNTATGWMSTVGGGWFNDANKNGASVGGGTHNLARAAYATISGGGPLDPNSPFSTNSQVYDDYGTIGGGANNHAGSNDSNTTTAQFVTIGGGRTNTASAQAATVGGGDTNTASGGSATVGGGFTNTASGYSATIGGGNTNTTSGHSATIGGGFYNYASGNYSSVGGGYTNTASGYLATIGGGYTNTASGESATIGGGDNNHASGDFSSVGGGNINTASGVSATVGGGDTNTASGVLATVGGGNTNTASGNSASVGGGANNTASQIYSSVGGGVDNVASGVEATVPGGRKNVASGAISFAAGNEAIASRDGTFVWADSTPHSFDPFSYTTSGGVLNSFNVRATGGVYLVTAVNASTGVPTAGMYLSGGGSGWNVYSDRSFKMNFQPVNSRDLLERLAGTPISTWNYKTQDASVRHIGPMAQDFNSAFGVGEPDKSGDKKYINSIDADGVALAAIQGLYQLNQEQAVEIQSLKAQLSRLEKTGAPQRTSSLPLVWVVVGLLGIVQAGMFLVILRKRGGRS